MLPTRSRARTRVTRRIAADPTSTALLLAGPTALDLWPGAQRLGEPDGPVVVERTTPDAPPLRVTVRALPPLRTPTAYVARFTWVGEDLPEVTGRVTLAYAPTGSGTPTTHAVVEVDVEPEGPYAGLQARAEGFLENLARAAEARNRAA